MTITQFIDLGLNVANRLKHYISKGTELPKPLRHLSTQLPLLVGALDRLKSVAEVERVDSNARYILWRVIGECMAEVKKMDEWIDGALKVPGDFLPTRVQKAFLSLKDDSKSARDRETRT